MKPNMQDYKVGLSPCDRYQSRMLSLDLYRRPFNFLLPDHESEYRTFLGSTLSIIQFVLLLLYGSYNLQQFFAQSKFNVN